MLITSGNKTQPAAWSWTNGSLNQVKSENVQETNGAGSAIFTSSGDFTVPPGVSRVRVLVVGGGHGGGSGIAGGGGSGFVRVGEFDVENGQNIPINVGLGGTGSVSKHMRRNNYGLCIQNSRAGGTSSFGDYLIADGGVPRNDGCGQRWSGGSGGSGGGAGCEGSCTSGNGGSDGSDGFNGTTPNDEAFAPGRGQGSFSATLRSLFRYNQLTPGEGGQGFASSNSGAGGGGAGGVLLNNKGPTVSYGQNGAAGGRGYGAGGGGARTSQYYHDNSEYFYHYAGGNGAGGLVYIEW